MSNDKWQTSDGKVFDSSISEYQARLHQDNLDRDARDRALTPEQRAQRELEYKKSQEAINNREVEVRRELEKNLKLAE